MNRFVPDARNIREKRNRAEGVLGSGDGRIRVRSGDGSITLRIAPGSGARNTD